MPMIWLNVTPGYCRLTSEFESALECSGPKQRRALQETLIEKQGPRGYAARLMF